MLNKPLAQIEKADIDQLIIDEERESRTLDYKEKLSLSSGNEKHNFLHDISALANTSGGDIIYGIVEKRDGDNKLTGLPEKAIGLDGQVNIDQLKLQIDNVVRSNVEPKIPGLSITHINGFEKGPVLIIRVSKSWNAPHMVKDTYKFYIRRNSSNEPMDVHEIRSAFALAEALPEKIRRFRDSRLSKIITKDSPVLMSDNLKYVLHIVPMKSFSPDFIINMDDRTTESIGKHSPIHGDSRYNLLGYLKHFSYRTPGQKPNNQYFQFFRNGIMEVVRDENHEETIASEAYEREIIEDTKKCINLSYEIGIELPIVVMLSLVNAKGYTMTCAPKSHSNTWNFPLNDDTVILPEVIIQEYSFDVSKAIRPIFDTIWQSVGWPKSLNYDENGKWIGMGRY